MTPIRDSLRKEGRRHGSGRVGRTVGRQYIVPLLMRHQNINVQARKEDMVNQSDKRVGRRIVLRAGATLAAAGLSRAEAQPRPLIIDSQVHAYAANTPERPWHTVPNWPAHVTGDEMVAAMDKVGVAGA